MPATNALAALQCVEMGEVGCGVTKRPKRSFDHGPPARLLVPRKQTIDSLEEPRQQAWNTPRGGMLSFNPSARVKFGRHLFFETGATAWQVADETFQRRRVEEHVRKRLAVLVQLKD